MQRDKYNETFLWQLIYKYVKSKYCALNITVDDSVGVIKHCANQ